MRATHVVWLVVLTSWVGCRCAPGRIVRACVDGDGDGFVLEACDRGAELDCDDTNKNVYPGSPEVLNGTDDDCDEEVDEGLPTAVVFLDADGDGVGAGPGRVAWPAPGLSLTNTDCDDTDPSVKPGAPERCNARDDDCDGLVDEGLAFETFFLDADQDGFGATDAGAVQSCGPVAGRVQFGGDCDDARASTRPGVAEQCNGRDDDCDGTIDEGLMLATYYVDADQDGFGARGVGQASCAPIAGLTTNADDCDDASAMIAPTATERCNGQDDDCDGAVDDVPGGCMATTSAPTWRPLTPSSREFHAAAYDSSRRALVVFGGQHDGHALADTWERAAGAWVHKPVSAGPAPRVAHAMAFDAARGKVVLFGGRDLSLTRFDDTWEWDGSSWLRRTPPTSPSPRMGHFMTWDAQRQRVVLFGGSPPGTLSNETWEWDGQTWAQRQTSRSPPASYFGQAMTYDVGRQRVVLFGGWSSSSHAETWEFDGADWTRRTPSTSPPARYLHALANDSAHGRVVLFGGDRQGQRLNDTWTWDGTSWAQLSTAQLPAGRGGHSLTWDEDRQRLVLFAGDDSGTTRLDDTWEFDGTTWVRVGLVMPSPRFFHGLVYDVARQRTVLFGGQGFMGSTNDTWEWNGTNWLERQLTNAPSRRHGMLAYDKHRSVTVLFGGSGLADTWEWNGTTWSQVTVTPAPPGRGGHALAYDETRRRVVLFGGLVNSAVSDDTWEFDGATWLQRPTGVRPPPRQQHVLVFDAVRHRTVLFGGQSAPGPMGPPLGDTWEWDGTTWLLKSTTGPSGRFGHGATFDARRNRVVVTAGRTSSMTFASDTWDWDGTSWVEQTLARQPTPRAGTAMTFDVARSQVQLFGGNVQADWWELGP